MVLVCRFPTPYRDGTDHARLDPLDFIARLAALVLKPGDNLTRFHGATGLLIDFAPVCLGLLLDCRCNVPGRDRRRGLSGDRYQADSALIFMSNRISKVFPHVCS